MKKSVIVTVAMCVGLLAGCSKVPDTDQVVRKAPKPKDGDTVLLFPEWETSGSAFERKVYTNYFVLRANGKWLVRERQKDGSLAVFWKSDSGYRDIDDVKSAFALNIQWNTWRELHDALAARGGTAPEKIEVGQVWVYSGSDPFNPYINSNKVVAVQDGYVQYVNQDGHTRSSSAVMFRVGSQMVKE